MRPTPTTMRLWVLTYRVGNDKPNALGTISPNIKTIRLIIKSNSRSSTLCIQVPWKLNTAMISDTMLLNIYVPVPANARIKNKIKNCVVLRKYSGF